MNPYRQPDGSVAPVILEAESDPFPVVIPERVYVDPRYYIWWPELEERWAIVEDRVRADHVGSLRSKIRAGILCYNAAVRQFERMYSEDIAQRAMWEHRDNRIDLDVTVAWQTASASEFPITVHLQLPAPRGQQPDEPNDAFVENLREHLRGFVSGLYGRDGRAPRSVTIRVAKGK